MPKKFLMKLIINKTKKFLSVKRICLQSLKPGYEPGINLACAPFTSQCCACWNPTDTKNSIFDHSASLNDDTGHTDLWTNSQLRFCIRYSDWTESATVICSSFLSRAAPENQGFQFSVGLEPVFAVNKEKCGIIWNDFTILFYCCDFVPNALEALSSNTYQK